jgi:cytochrome c biogenesis protein CcdA
VERDGVKITPEAVAQGQDRDLDSGMHRALPDDRQLLLRLIGLVVSIGLVDSVNPSTVGPALYLAGHASGPRRVSEFTIAVFLVYLLGGALIILGPGQLLLNLVPRPGHDLGAALELGIGIVMSAAAGVLWRHRERLLRPPSEGRLNPRNRHSAILGATITALELPTAFPYFAAIAAVAGSGVGTARELMLLILFNVCFVVPLVSIVAVLVFARQDSLAVLASARRWLRAAWPRVVAGLVAVTGVIVMAIGAAGLAA